MNEGCGRSFEMGFNTKVNSAVIFQCGVLAEYGKPMFCDACEKQEGEE